MQSISAVTLPVADMAAAQRFYEQGFGWTPTYTMEDLRFYQLNSLVLVLWGSKELADDAGRGALPPPGGMALAHNVAAREDVAPLMERLAGSGGSITRHADAPPHGGFRGYVADPDGHLWEIAWNPAWPLSGNGGVIFGI